MKQSEDSGKSASQNEVSDSEEEEKREFEKIKRDVVKHLLIKDEPLTVVQISYAIKYAKKYCEEALAALIAEG